MKERKYLIARDGINGRTIGRLRDETNAGINGVREEHFQEPSFVAAATDWHEARLLAEGGFTGTKNEPLEQRYRRTEAALLARITGPGRGTENQATDNGTDRIHDLAATTGTKETAAYGSAEHYEAFAASLAGTASAGQVKGRLAAARGEATHPSEAFKQGRKAPKARTVHIGLGLEAGKTRSGPSR